MAINQILIKSVLALCLCFVTLQYSFGEKSDHEKPINIEADRVEIDDLKKEALFVGNVVLTQGTLQIKAEKILVKEDANGFKHGTAYGNPVWFQQKQEIGSGFIEGTSLRMNYNGQLGKIELLENAKLSRGPDEVTGDYISYDAMTEYFQIIGNKGASGDSSKKNGRVKAVINPQKRKNKTD